MFKFNRFCTFAALASTALCLGACGSDDEDTDTGGSGGSATGGSAGTGGTDATGGSAGNGAVPGNTIVGTVSYTGSAVGNLVVAGFTSWPGKPTVTKLISDPKFPVEYEISNVDAGTYFVVARLDVAPASKQPGPEDKMSDPGKETVAVTDTEGVKYDITIPD